MQNFSLKFEGQRPRRRQKDNIKVFLKENGYQYVDWICLIFRRIILRRILKELCMNA